jgi:hypothetical protein
MLQVLLCRNRRPFELCQAAHQFEPPLFRRGQLCVLSWAEITRLSTLPLVKPLAERQMLPTHVGIRNRCLGVIARRLHVRRWRGTACVIGRRHREPAAQGSDPKFSIRFLHIDPNFSEQCRRLSLLFLSLHPDFGLVRRQALQIPLPESARSASQSVSQSVGQSAAHATGCTGKRECIQSGREVSHTPLDNPAPTDG